MQRLDPLDKGITEANGKKNPEPTRPPRERAFLVGVELRSEPALLPLEDSLAELSLLADTAGLDVIGEAYPKAGHAQPEYIISGLEKLKRSKHWSKKPWPRWSSSTMSFPRATCASWRNASARMSASSTAQR